MDSVARMLGVVPVVMMIACGSKGSSATPVPAPTGSLSGHVRLAGLATQGGVQVILAGPTGGSALTGSDGRYEFSALGTGSYAVLATAASTVEGTVSALAVVTTGAATVPDLTLTPTGAISGRVTLGVATGNAGITVGVPGTSAFTMTDDEGHYLLLDVPAGARDVVASLPGYGTGLAAVAVTWRGTAAAPDLTLGFAAGGGLRGQVLLVGGDPGGATVALIGTGLTQTTDAGGRFAFTHVPEGIFTLTVRKGAWEAEVPNVLSLLGGSGYILGGSLYPIGTIEVERGRQVSGPVTPCSGLFPGDQSQAYMAAWWESPAGFAWFPSDCDPATGLMTIHLARVGATTSQEVGRRVRYPGRPPGNGHLIMLSEADPVTGSSTLTSADGATGAVTELSRGVRQLHGAVGTGGGASWIDHATGHLLVGRPGQSLIDLGSARFAGTDSLRETMFYFDPAGALWALDLATGASLLLANDAGNSVAVQGGLWAYQGSVSTTPVGTVRHVDSGITHLLGRGWPDCSRALGGTRWRCLTLNGGPTGSEYNADLIDDATGERIPLSTVATRGDWIGSRLVLQRNFDPANGLLDVDLIDPATGAVLWSRTRVLWGYAALPDGRLPFFTEATGGVGTLNLLDASTLAVVTASGSACSRSSFLRVSSDGSRVLCQGDGSPFPVYSASATTSGPATLLVAGAAQYFADATGAAVLYQVGGNLYMAGVAAPIATSVLALSATGDSGVVFMRDQVAGPPTTYTVSWADFTGSVRPIASGWSYAMPWPDGTHAELYLDAPGGQRTYAFVNLLTGALSASYPATCRSLQAGSHAVIISSANAANVGTLQFVPLPGTPGEPVSKGLTHCYSPLLTNATQTRVLWTGGFDATLLRGELHLSNVDGSATTIFGLSSSIQRRGDGAIYIGDLDPASNAGVLRTLSLADGAVASYVAGATRYQVLVDGSNLVVERHAASPPPYAFQDGLYRLTLH